MTVDKLLEQFVLSKYTGLERPGKKDNLSNNIKKDIINTCCWILFFINLNCYVDVVVMINVRIFLKAHLVNAF